MEIDAVAKVGISVLVRRSPQEFLVGLRTGSHGAGEWWLPGGKPDPDETPKEAAIREVYEETGITLIDARPIPLWTYDRWPEFNRHFVCVYFEGIAHPEDDAAIIEPDKCLEWRWVKWHTVPHPHDTSIDLLGPHLHRTAQGWPSPSTDLL